jgi:Uma2 family endonuclease
MSEYEYPNKSLKEKRDILKEENLTYDDYASFDDEQRYELVDGKLELMSPAPSTLHQAISFEIQKRIALTCENEVLIFNAPIDVILSQKEVRQPDLVILRTTQLHLLSKRGIEGAPDVVVEILSPSTTKRDKLVKMKSYARHGIPEYWIVDPLSGVLELFSLSNDKYELTNVFTESDPVISNILPCVSFSMQEIMDRIPDVIK